MHFYLSLDRCGGSLSDIGSLLGDGSLSPTGSHVKLGCLQRRSHMGDGTLVRFGYSRSPYMVLSGAGGSLAPGWRSLLVWLALDIWFSQRWWLAHLLWYSRNVWLAHLFWHSLSNLATLVRFGTLNASGSLYPFWSSQKVWLALPRWSSPCLSGFHTQPLSVDSVMNWRIDGEARRALVTAAAKHLGDFANIEVTA